MEIIFSIKLEQILSIQKLFSAPEAESQKKFKYLKKQLTSPLGYKPPPLGFWTKSWKMKLLQTYPYYTSPAHTKKKQLTSPPRILDKKFEQKGGL